MLVWLALLELLLLKRYLLCVLSISIYQMRLRFNRSVFPMCFSLWYPWHVIHLCLCSNRWWKPSWNLWTWSTSVSIWPLVVSIWKASILSTGGHPGFRGLFNADCRNILSIQQPYGYCNVHQPVHLWCFDDIIKLTWSLKPGVLCVLLAFVMWSRSRDRTRGSHCCRYVLLRIRRLWVWQ